MDKKDIYCITNNINGMQYVGQSKDAHKRFKAHALAKDKTYFHSEIRKYGIDNFVDETTVADARIDGNSNVSHKDIVTLEKEMPKPHEKLLAFNKIYYEIQKKFGFQAANEWLREEWIGRTLIAR